MSQTPSQTPRERGKFLEFLLALLKIILNDWPMKLLALLLAIALWAGLITQDPSLTREKRFTDVAVTVNGTETLKRNGFIVISDLDALLDDVTVTADVPQMQYSNAQASNYSVRIELSRIKSAGVQAVNIMTSNSGIYGSVASVEPSSITLEVDEYITRYRIPVTAVIEGETPEGYYADQPSLEPSIIAVSGPRSIVDRIVRAEVTVPMDTLPSREGTIRRAIPFTLIDSEGQIVQSDLLEVTSESVLVDSILAEQKMYTKKTVALSELGLLRGEPAEGYEIKDWSVTPSVVTVAGSREAMETLDVLYADSYVNVTGMTESINKSLRLRQPSGMQYSSVSAVTVAVEIGPVISSRTFSKLRAQVQNVGEGLAASMNVNTTGTISIDGPKLWLDSLTASDVQLYCDAQDLGAGVYDLPLQCTIEGSHGMEYTVQLEPRTVRVIITENE